MRKLVTIREIKDLQPIEGADFIELATIDGWYVIVKKGDFTVGDKCIYAEIDSVFPETEEFEFLRPKRFRIKTIKMRGCISQGIAFPMSILDGKKYDTDTRENPVYTFNLGDDVTALLGVKLYEPPQSGGLGGESLGNFPSFVPRTDLERVQNLDKIWDYITKQGHIYYMTEKLNGTSMTCYLRDEHFGVCSRNLEKKNDGKNLYWRAAINEGIEEKIRSAGKNIAVQGELIGQGVQGNPYKLEGNMFVLFDVYDIDEHKYYEYHEIIAFCEDYDFHMVPILCFARDIDCTIDVLLEYADGTSLLNRDTLREGIAIRMMPEVYHPKIGRVSFKAISNKYLLKEK